MVETILAPVNIIVGLYTILDLIVWATCTFGQQSCTENFPFIPSVLLVVLEVIRRWARNKSQSTAYGWKKKFFIRLIVLLVLDFFPAVEIFSSQYGGLAIFAIVPLLLINIIVLVVIIIKAVEDYKNKAKDEN